MLDLLVMYVMYVSMYEGRANYQYYALQGSGIVGVRHQVDMSYPQD